MEDSKKSLLDEFAEKAAPSLYGLAAVPDNWINQLKVYHKVEIDDGTISVIWITTLCLYVELLIARIDDLVTPSERRFLEQRCINKLLHFFQLVNPNEQGVAQKQAGGVENVMHNIIDSSRKTEIEKNLSIPQMYSYSFINTLGKQIPEVILTEYIQSKIELFEEVNLRKSLQEKLEQMHPQER